MSQAPEALDPQARAWVAAQLGSPVVAGVELTGGVASQMLRVTTRSGRHAVLRRLVADPWRRFAEALLTREMRVQDQLASSGVPAPRPLAVDVHGSEAGAPSLLMTLLPGRIDLVACGEETLAGLAGTLLDIHRHVPAPDGWPRAYQSWAFEEKRVVPPWSRDDGLYREAFARLAAPAPGYAPTFLHRDFYPANVLWDRGRVTGVVDWVETSTGPADLDVAHCASNLAGLHGAEVALAFRRAYVDAGGLLEEDADASRYWQLLDLVGFLPTRSGRESGADPGVLPRVWAANGRGDLTEELARGRREDLLRAVLAG